MRRFGDRVASLQKRERSGDRVAPLQKRERAGGRVAFSRRERMKTEGWVASHQKREEKEGERKICSGARPS